MKYLLSIVLLLPLIVTAQDSTKSLAHKINKPEIKYPLVKPVGRTYPLISGFALVKEANAGDPLAQHELGIRYLQGLGFPKDTTHAIYWVNRAAAQNLATAKYNMGIFATKGVGLDWNPFFAFRMFKETALKGFPPGQLAYGLSYIHDLVVNRNMDEAYKWIKLSSDVDFEPAKKILHNLLESGYTPPDSMDNLQANQETLSEDASAFGTDWDIDFMNFDADTSAEKTKSRIEELFGVSTQELKDFLRIDKIEDSTAVADTSNFGLIEYAAGTGGPEALMMQGIAFENGINYKKNNIKALLSYLTAIRNGSRRAGMLIYDMLKDDNVVKEIEKRAKSGNADAKYVWAGLIAFGYDYSILLNDALNLLEEAADQGHLQSLIELGVIYYKGEIVEQDKIRAYSYWERAVRLGSDEAAVRLSITKIFNNDYTKSSLHDLISTINEARKKGVIIAETALGYCYENGIGVKKDKAFAAELYWNATMKGNDAGFLSLKRMYDEVRPEDEIYQIYEKNF